MDGREIVTKIFFLLCLLLSPGTVDGRKINVSANQKDITTPITTVPTIIPSTPPILNPNSNPDSPAPAIMTPMTIPAQTTSPAGGSWCVASQSASQTALQVGLDYACGYGGADCATIQAGGACYNPNTVRDHASYAFNSYYQKNPIPSSCNFGGTAVTTSSDPSSGTCQYQSTSTSSSILNITNSNGSNVFGAVPTRPSPWASAATDKWNLSPPKAAMASLILLLATYYTN